MANDCVKRSEVPLCAFIILLLTHCYSVFAILDRRVYVDEDLRKNYKIEDFLWSGSGDGENETELTGTEEKATWEHTTTIFHTTTIISTSTVFYNSLSTAVFVDSGTATINCSSTSRNSTCSITPTPTVHLIPNTASISPWPPPSQYPPFTDAIPDQRYWLITVLKVNSTDTGFVPFQLEEHLAKLYRTAFHRHQEQHLGLQRASNASQAWSKATLRSQYLAGTRKRRDHRDDRDAVTVHVHNVSNNEVLNILYSVRVSGVPVLATTAAHDMKLVSDAEVVAELGFPVVTKAEPYLKSKPTAREDLSTNKDYVVVLVSSLCTAVLVVLLVLIFLLTVKKRKKIGKFTKENPLKSGQLITSREGQVSMSSGVDNAAFVSENGGNASNKRPSACLKKSEADSTQIDVNGRVDSQRYSRLPLDRPTSPNSFLSMPSVRDFPTTLLPEPLTNLLNTNSPPLSSDETKDVRARLSRHGSLGGEDPGVVGPMVWHVHRHRLEKAGKVQLRKDESSSTESDVDVGRMRKRLNELLDDALSAGRKFSDDYVHMDEGRNFRTRVEYDDDIDVSYSVDQTQLRNFQRRSQSAVNTSRDVIEVTDDISKMQLRPRTSRMGEPHKPRVVAPKPGIPEVRSAWVSTGERVPSSVRLHSRPLSAGPFHRPVVQPEFILSDAQLSSNDPAVSIISAIKEELDKIPKYKYKSDRHDVV